MGEPRTQQALRKAPPPSLQPNPPEVWMGDQTWALTRLSGLTIPRDRGFVTLCRAQTGLWRAPQVQAQLDRECPVCRDPLSSRSRTPSSMAQDAS